MAVHVPACVVCAGLSPQNSSDPDTLINLVAVSQHLHKAPEAIAKLLAQLQRVAPQHPYVAGLATLETAFDRLATQYDSHIRR